MKIVKILIIGFASLVLQGCDSTESKVKKVLMCGIAVDELGNSQARINYKNNIPKMFGGKEPNINSYDIKRIAGEAREELYMDFPGKEKNLELLLEEYEEGYCEELHKQPNTDRVQFVKKVLD
ncbi:MAG: Uncharacterized protein K0S95_737 [Pantoea eucrina]|jgi:hypothetical protein|nr:Uncharacterized protein [Pantoea eucrina]